MADQPKILDPDQIESVEQPQVEEAIDKAEHGIVPQGYADGRPSTEHEDEGWRAARLSKP